MLNETEKRIADFLLATDIRTISAEKIAEKLYVSRSSIYRVCKKMGYNSFTEFKYAKVQKELAPHIELKDVNSMDVFINVDDSQMKAIFNCMIQTSCIYVMGTYATAIAAKYLTRQLINLNRFVIQIEDAMELIERSKQLREQDLLLYLSNSGEPGNEMMALMEQLKTTKVALTKADSTLAQACDFSITFDFSIYKNTHSFDRENIFPLIVISQKLLINFKELVEQ